MNGCQFEKSPHMGQMQDFDVLGVHSRLCYLENELNHKSSKEEMERLRVELRDVAGTLENRLSGEIKSLRNVLWGALFTFFVTVLVTIIV